LARGFADGFFGGFLQKEKATKKRKKGHMFWWIIDVVLNGDWRTLLVAMALLAALVGLWILQG
jgi:hypothetical protein